MEYDKEFWDKYADENESRNNDEFTKFLTDLVQVFWKSDVEQVLI